MNYLRRLMTISSIIVVAMIMQAQSYYNLSLSDEFIAMWRQQGVIPITIASTYKDKVIAIKKHGLQPIGYWQTAQTTQEARAARGMQLLEKQARSFVLTDKKHAQFNIDPVSHTTRNLHSVIVPGDVLPKSHEFELHWDEHYKIIPGAGIIIPGAGIKLRTEEAR